MDKRTKRLAIGTVVAAAAGFVAGILTAPKSGKETRQDLKETANRTYSAAEKELKSLHTELSKLMDEANKKADEVKGTARKNLDKAMDSAQVAKGKAREFLSAIHEGDANDEDLGNAIKEAKKAVGHLKDYLKK